MLAARTAYSLSPASSAAVVRWSQLAVLAQPRLSNCNRIPLSRLRWRCNEGFHSLDSVTVMCAQQLSGFVLGEIKLLDLQL